MFKKMNIFSGTNSFKEVVDVFSDLLLSRNIVTGKEIKIYEDKFKAYIKSDAVYSFASGRMGLYLSLKAMKLDKDDEIIIPAYTCEVVPNAIILGGVKPIYCDINLVDFNIDVTKIEELITSKTKVIYAQHTFGQMCDIKVIKQIAKKYNLYVIEDTALTLGAKLDNQYAGTIGDIGYFSTDRSKVINTGQGGMVSINNPRLKEKYEALYNDIEYFDERFTKGMARTFIINYLVHKPLFHKIGRYFYAIISRLKLLTYIPEEFIYKLPKNYPYPAKLSNILAKIGISQINKLNDNIDYRKSIAKQINSKLKIFDEECINTKENIFLRYSFLVKNRDSWEKKFRNKIDLGIWFKTPIAGLEWNELHKVHYKIESCPNAEYASKHILNIPTHSQIDIHDLDNLLSSLYKSNDTIKVVL